MREVVNQGIKDPSAITVFEDHMYWIDQRKIVKANKFTGKNVTVLLNQAESPKDLHIYHPQRQPHAVTPCSKDNGNCSHLCLLSSGAKKFTCNCPNGLYLQADGRTCNSTMPPTTKPSPSSSSTVSSPASVSYSTEEPVVKQQSGQDDSKPNYGIILGAVFGVVGFIAIVFIIILLIIARRKRSPKLEIHYTADQDVPDDKAIIVKPDGVYTKRPAIFKGNLNRNFHNVNYMEGQGSVEYDEDDDDETRPVVLKEDIV